MTLKGQFHDSTRPFGLLKPTTIRKIRRVKQLAWEKLHCGNWRSVSIAWRHLYALCARLELWSCREQMEYALFAKQLDLAVVLGHPRDAACCQQLLLAHPPPVPSASCCHLLPMSCSHSRDSAVPRALNPHLELDIAHLPASAACSLFHAAHVDTALPCVLQAATDGWPAACSSTADVETAGPTSAKWAQLAFWQGVLGQRYVPLEIGSHYMSKQWTQKMLPGDALLAQICSEPHCAAHANKAGEDAASHEQKMYLAQHDLFSQIPQLLRDIVTPPHCLFVPRTPDSCGDSAASPPPVGPDALPRVCWRPRHSASAAGGGGGGAPEPPLMPDYAGWWQPQCPIGHQDGVLRQIWMGPQGTVSNLHFDDKLNILVQVAGCKRVILVPPEHSVALQPHEGTAWNTAQVDLWSTTAPSLPGVRWANVHLAPGDALFIPPGWWHHITAATDSISVSFWWDG